MKAVLLSLLTLSFLFAAPDIHAAAPLSNIPELSTLLVLFSANATSSEGVRLNWTLDRQSPTIVSFRIYRGYEEVGNFAVIADVPIRQGKDTMDYAFSDTGARGGVTYYYKIASLGQNSESVFPVVITATRPLPGESTVAHELPPVSILKGNKIALYVRNGGHVKLQIALPSQILVNDSLKPGIYEFDPPPNAKAGLRLHLEHDTGFTTDVNWPVD
jgi:hypothetical protein